MKQLNQMQMRNDIFRKSVMSRPQKHGKVVYSFGICDLPDNQILSIQNAVRNFSDFNTDNDPHKEHDIGMVMVDDIEVWWKIEYYEDEHCTRPRREDWGENQRDFLTAYRVLTIMLVEEI